MSQLYSNSIFWIDVDKINPNPFQPRREFEPTKLKDLSDSIRMYGVLQPLVVSRVEHEKPDGGLVVEYELIAGERRLRASKLAGLTQVPVVIRVGDDNLMKLELAIIENLQREDLNAVERARAFYRFVNEFKYTHAQIGTKMGKSREYVSNTLRLLQLPEEILNALSEGKITEGHTRPIMMLQDRPEEQMVLFKEILYKKITVREAEKIARKIAFDRVRKVEYMPDPEINELESMLQEKLGTRVHIERDSVGGHIQIDYFTNEDLRGIIDIIQSTEKSMNDQMASLKAHEAKMRALELQKQAAKEDERIIFAGVDNGVLTEGVMDIDTDGNVDTVIEQTVLEESSIVETEPDIDLLDDRSKEEKKESEDDLYNINNFSL